MAEKTSVYREDFPGYQGHIPYKIGVIGKTVNATNETIKQLLTTEPPKETLLKPTNCEDFSYYDRDYYCDKFNREYPLEEDLIFSNKSKDAQTWLSSDKYKIFPQHIPGVKCHVPGIYSSNIHGMGYSKSTAISIKGNYNKGQDCSDKERFTSSNMDNFKRPRRKTLEEELEMEKYYKFLNPMDSNYNSKLMMTGKNAFRNDLRRIYKSKIAEVPTVGYAGHTSIFHKKVSYLNFDKIKKQEQEMEKMDNQLGEGLPERFRESLKTVQPDLELPYVVGYKGFRVGVKARNHHAENFHDLSLRARNETKFLNTK